MTSRSLVPRSAAGLEAALLLLALAPWGEDPPSAPAPADGIKLADALGSRLLTVEGDGHTAVSAGKNDCVNGVLAAYLIDLELPGDGATCTL